MMLGGKVMVHKSFHCWN